MKGFSALAARACGEQRPQPRPVPCSGDRLRARRFSGGRTDDGHRYRHARSHDRRARQAAGLLALCRPQLPEPRVLGRHPSAHQLVHGRRRLRQPARLRGGLPLRPWRGTGRLGRRAREAVAPARLPGYRRPLRQHGLLPGAVFRQARDARRRDRPQMVRHGAGRRRGKGVKAALDIIDNFSRGTFPPALQFLPGSDGYRSTWEQIIAAAEKYNEPGHFSAFIGYEWTSQVPPGNNLHRVVIYRDGGDQAIQTLPFTTYPPLGSTSRRTCGSNFRPTRTRPAGGCWPSRTTAISRTAGCSPPRPIRPPASLCRRNMPRRAPGGSRSTRQRRSRATARRIPISRPPTNSPATNCGTSATSTSANRNSPRCCRANMPAPRCRPACSWRQRSASIPTSSA